MTGAIRITPMTFKTSINLHNREGSASIFELLGAVGGCPSELSGIPFCFLANVFSV
jgi:hypothetical protein